MPAFNKVPKAQRDRLAALTGAHNRFIGGSADTMYIPRRHRKTFMSTLALFLQTNCFLEIAAPTALHLALPPHEEILYVDHVRRGSSCIISLSLSRGFFFLFGALCSRKRFDVTDTFFFGYFFRSGGCCSRRLTRTLCGGS